MKPLLSIRNLRVGFQTSQGLSYAVESFDMDLYSKEVLTIVGESGSGKSVAMLAFMGLLPEEAVITADLIEFFEQDWLALNSRQKRKIIAKEIGMIFQEPSTSINPCFTVGWQISEKLRLFQNLSKKKAKEGGLKLFEKVGMPDPEARYNSYPHQLSGGMNQRVMISMAIACNPKLIIADEPTTALDVTIQAQILDLLRDLQQSEEMSLILITHDIGVVAEMADRVLVQYAGFRMEENECEQIIHKPAHPYTKALLDSLPENNFESRLPVISGNIPSIHDKPKGCVFHLRCNFCESICTKETPTKKGSAYCHFPIFKAAEIS